MDQLYEIEYKRPSRTRFCKGCSCGLSVGDHVVVEGHADVGKVVWKGQSDASEMPCNGASIRPASSADDDLALDIKQKERAAFDLFEEKIDEHDLPMNPIGVDWDVSGDTITFHFTSHKRVDFRALVRDLARVYHRRIELRQVSPRIETQRMGGCGACGRELCCSSFIEKPQMVPSQMAHSQTTSQNLSKLVGVCGQLKCCLRYE
ncbi:MAG: cell fate regulator YaaT (PSP1 superfamily) [Candidatus Latescibacterota bacterium]|jgi:cell fate regulator YaaT (PSP1 superfamily)